MQIGAQLWLFHTVMEDDVMTSILTQLRDAKYDYVETMYGKPPQNRAVLDSIGLRCYATHVALSAMPPRAELVDFAHRMGAETVCVSGLVRWNERTADDYRRGAAALNEWGARLQEDGLALHYHNHEFEFDAVEGAKTGMEMLLSDLDPSLVWLCFDAGWTSRSGHDPITFAAQYAQRIQTVHLRDFRGTQSVPLGAGDLDLTRIVPPLFALPQVQAILIEQDPATETPVADMADSRRFLQERFGL